MKGRSNKVSSSGLELLEASPFLTVVDVHFNWYFQLEYCAHKPLQLLCHFTHFNSLINLKEKLIMNLSHKLYFAHYVPITLDQIRPPNHSTLDQVCSAPLNHSIHSFPLCRLPLRSISARDVREKPSPLQYRFDVSAWTRACLYLLGKCVDTWRKVSGKIKNSKWSDQAACVSLPEKKLKKDFFRTWALATSIPNCLPSCMADVPYIIE